MERYPNYVFWALGLHPPGVTNQSVKATIKLIKNHVQEIVAIGEVGLSGELRAVSQLERRVAEAARLGFKRCLVPKVGDRINFKDKDIEVIPASSLREAIRAGLIKESPRET